MMTVMQQHTAKERRHTYPKVIQLPAQRLLLVNFAFPNVGLCKILEEVKQVGSEGLVLQIDKRLG